MTLPSFIFGSLISIFFASAYHFWRRGGGGKLLIYLATSFAGFWAGHIFGNIIEPKFAGDKLSLSPIVILLSLFTWYWIWGIGGMILAIPLTSIMKIVFSRIKVNKNIAKFMS